MAETSRASSSESKEVAEVISKDGETVVLDCRRSKSICGYCPSSGRTSVAHGLWADSVTVDDYQELIDRGWSRSGCYLYKPEMSKTCCPSYTIRLKASDFTPSKDQIRARRLMKRFLDDDKHNGKKRKLEFHLNKSSFDQEEYDLYKRYQIKVHNKQPNEVYEGSYKSFLVDSPLIYVPPSGSNYPQVPPSGFGSFHQQYVIDGKLVAVGVVDILPKCLSSMYFFWDPDFAFLSLGKYSSLQEINWVKDNRPHCSSLEYYYLGYYIHSCSKMNYKASYRPSELLCPLRYEWVSFDTAKPFLDTSKYVVLSDIIGKEIPPLGNSETSLIAREGEGDEDDEASVGNDEESMEESVSDESDSDTDVEDVYLGDIVVEIRGTRLKYKGVWKDLQKLFVMGDNKYFDAQLRRYKRAVGDHLSRRIVYSL